MVSCFYIESLLSCLGRSQEQVSRVEKGRGWREQRNGGQGEREREGELRERVRGREREKGGEIWIERPGGKGERKGKRG